MGTCRGFFPQITILLKTYTSSKRFFSMGQRVSDLQHLLFSINHDLFLFSCSSFYWSVPFITLIKVVMDCFFPPVFLCIAKAIGLIKALILQKSFLHFIARNNRIGLAKW